MTLTPVTEYRTAGGALITVHRATLLGFWFRGYGWKCSGCGSSQPHAEHKQPVQRATADAAANTHAGTCHRIP
ncbi:hypothetical protein [Kitasatospora sp. NPDC057223]|uniref:hypothetical protein n=1 Tax=Kitasatospora sp. NPDC057223 TaxID=3346055 RepID=UPI0036445017